MKKTLFLFSLMAVLVTFTANAIRGDVDGDGNVGISDVTALIDYILSHDASGINPANADVDGDGVVGIADVTALIDLILRGPAGNDEVDHEWVDLGLPSGTLWATTNIGAEAPEEYGSYFAWGETAPKDHYEWDNYLWYDEVGRHLTKYCTNPDYGLLDGLTVLDLDDDAAFVNWGPEWRMPTHEQQKELLECCTWKWTIINGVTGYQVSSEIPNDDGEVGSSIFLPAAGFMHGGEVLWDGTDGLYWSCDLESSMPMNAFDLELTNRVLQTNWLFRWYFEERFFGYTVRAVRVGN